MGQIEKMFKLSLISGWTQNRIEIVGSIVKYNSEKANDAKY